MYGYQESEVEAGDVNWENGIDIYSLLHIKYVTNEDSIV